MLKQIFLNVKNFHDYVRRKVKKLILQVKTRKFPEFDNYVNFCYNIKEFPKGCIERDVHYEKC